MKLGNAQRPIGGRRDEQGRAEAAERRDRVHERQAGRVDVRDVGGDSLDDDRAGEHDQQRVHARQVGDGDEGVQLAGGGGRPAADDGRDQHGRGRGGEQPDPHVAPRRRVAAEVGDARHQRQRGARHHRDVGREPGPRRVLVGRAEDAAGVEARIVGGQVQREQHAREGERDGQDDSQHVTHHVEPEHRQRCVEEAEPQRDRDERRLVPSERDHDRLDPERACQRLGGEPVGGGDHPVRGGESARAPEAECPPHRHLAR